MGIALDEKIIREAILQRLEVEIWREYEPRYGRGSRIERGLMGSGRIVRHTQYEIVLDDGEHYPKAGAEILIKQP